MKMDVTDPRYKPERDSGTVYLNGQLMKDCVAFDDREGWIEVLDRDERGAIRIDREKDRVIRKRLTGTVLYKSRNLMVY